MVLNFPTESQKSGKSATNSSVPSSQPSHNSKPNNYSNKDFDYGDNLNKAAYGNKDFSFAKKDSTYGNKDSGYSNKTNPKEHSNKETGYNKEPVFGNKSRPQIEQSGTSSLPHNRPTSNREHSVRKYQDSNRDHQEHQDNHPRSTQDHRFKSSESGPQGSRKPQQQSVPPRFAKMNRGEGGQGSDWGGGGYSNRNDGERSSQYNRDEGARGVVSRNENNQVGSNQGSFRGNNNQRGGGGGFKQGGAGGFSNQRGDGRGSDGQTGDRRNNFPNQNNKPFKENNQYQQGWTDDRSTLEGLLPKPNQPSNVNNRLHQNDFKQPYSHEQSNKKPFQERNRDNRSGARTENQKATEYGTNNRSNNQTSSRGDRKEKNFGQSGGRPPRHQDSGYQSPDIQPPGPYTDKPVYGGQRVSSTF